MESSATVEHKVSRLGNGLTVISAEMPHMASVSLGIWAGVGGRHEPAGLSGISHFIEHLLFKGTARRSAREISEAVEGIGGSLNAYTSEEHSCFFARARHDRFDDLLDVLSDMFLRSRFDPADVRKEREVIKEELAMYLDQPHQHVQELLNEAMWPGQALGRSITGTVKTLNAISRDALVDYHRANYVADAIVIAAAGRVRHEQVTSAVKRLAGQFRRGKGPAYVPATSRQTRPTIALHTKKTEQTQMALGFRACSRHDPRRFALRVLNALLGENMSSRLFQTIREDKGLAYSIYSAASFFDDAGDLVISAGLDHDTLSRTLRLIARELKRFTVHLTPRAELRRAADYLAGQIDLSLENSENQMMWGGEQWLNYGRIVPPDQVKKRLMEVRPAEVRAVARDFFRADRATLALVSPLKSARGLDKMLTVLA
jgi:predicted Zn-dependent peptidase